MFWRFSRLLIAFLFAITCYAPSQAAETQPAPCALTQFASLDLRIEDGSLLVDGKINDQESRILIDTGGISGISKQLAERLKLNIIDKNNLHFVDAANGKLDQSAIVNKITLGNMSAVNKEFLVFDEGNKNGGGFDASVGQDFLSNYDVEIDFFHRKLNLFSKVHCKDIGAYWTQDFASVPFKLSGLHVDVPVTLDGKETYAMLDTGTTLSLIGKRDADHIFGLKIDNLKPDGQVTAAGGMAEKFYKHKFEKLEIGDLAIKNPEIDIVNNNVNGIYVDPVFRWFSDSIGIILGLRQLKELRIYINYADKMLYVSAADAH